MKNPEMLTAIVFGGSGLTGRFLTELLVKDNRYTSILLFVRKEIKVYDGKIKQIIFNPDNLDNVLDEIKGDQVFCCIGTTIKKAGSKESFLEIDHKLIVSIAKASSHNGIPVLTFISSIGAKPESPNFYLNTKGITEEAIKILKFENLNILRPSLLLGLRPDHRHMEEFSKVMLKFLGFLLVGKFKKYRPIHAETVARAMIKVANENTGISVIESDEIEQLGVNQ
jgi:uncharacterized protein YbjT (DUF2867 family)